MPISSDMGGLLPTLILSLIAVFVLAAESASARPKKHPFKNSVAPTMQYQHGTPVIMQGMKWSKGPARTDDRPKERAERPRTIPRGSSSYLPPIPSPSPPSVMSLRPPPAPYTPPPINSFSDRVTQCNHSFPLNAGLGNNPTTRDAYVRYCVNN
jgi:hypothetical protein